MAKKRTGYKHGKWVQEPVPHADIHKYVDRQTGKTDEKKGSRQRSETMEFKKPKEARRMAQRDRTRKSSGGGVGIQTHGGRLGSALNTKVPDHSKYLNEYGYLKGGVPVKNG